MLLARAHSGLHPVWAPPTHAPLCAEAPDLDHCPLAHSDSVLLVDIALHQPLGATPGKSLVGTLHSTLGALAGGFLAFSRDSELKFRRQQRGVLHLLAGKLITARLCMVPSSLQIRPRGQHFSNLACTQDSDAGTPSGAVVSKFAAPELFSLRVLCVCTVQAVLPACAVCTHCAGVPACVRMSLHVCVFSLCVHTLYTCVLLAVHGSVCTCVHSCLLCAQCDL